jgi:hypothetical protein
MVHVLTSLCVASSLSNSSCISLSAHFSSWLHCWIFSYPCPRISIRLVTTTANFQIIPFKASGLSVLLLTSAPSSWYCHHWLHPSFLHCPAALPAEASVSSMDLCSTASLWYLHILPFGSVPGAKTWSLTVNSSYIICSSFINGNENKLGLGLQKDSVRGIHLRMSPS